RLLQLLVSQLFFMSWLFDLFSSAREWKTDKKSLLLLFIGLPIGAVVLCIVTLVVFELVW
ncbi:hypothetical protein KC686_03420, partial [Candidatus Woesebacteria bacterium]|nr:hypothetical protein [Candidatus Woesebacteria bacterium]